MRKNIGTAERWLRIIAGLIILSLIYFIDSDWRWIGLIGIVPLATALVGWCPVYALFGISSCKIPANNGAASDAKAAHDHRP